MFVLKNLIPLLNVLLGLNLNKKEIAYRLFGMLISILANFTVLPFIFSRKLKIVKLISTLCSFALAVSFLVIVFAFFNPKFIGESQQPIDWSQLVYWNSNGFYITIGYYLLSFCFQAMVIDITTEIRPRTSISSDVVLFFNCFTSVIVYLIVSFLGYLTIYAYGNIKDMENYLTFLIVNLHKR